MGVIKDGSKRGLSCKRMLVHFKAEIAIQSMSFHASNPLGESWKYKDDIGHRMMIIYVYIYLTLLHGTRFFSGGGGGGCGGKQYLCTSKWRYCIYIFLHIMYLILQRRHCFNP